MASTGIGAEGRFLILVLGGRHVAHAHLDRDLGLEHALFRERRDGDARG